MSEETPSPESPAPVRRHAPIRWRRWAIRGVFEGVLIVLSVVLALAVTNWADQRRTEARVQEMRGFVVEEIHRNRATLSDDYWLAHHERLRSEILAIAQRENLTRDDGREAMGILFATGIHVGATRDTVWRSLEASDLLSELEPAEIFMLSDIYRTQSHVAGVEQAILGGLGPLLESIESGQGLQANLIRMQMHLTDMVGMERRLLENYDQALKVLDPDGDLAPRPTAAKGDGDAAPATR